MKLHCTVLVHCLVHFIFRLLDKVVLTMSNKLHDPHTIHILPILEDSRFCYHGMKSLCSISRDAVTMHPKIMEAKISVIKFWQCFFRLKCIFGHLFISLQTFVLFFLLDNTCDSSCFQDHVMSSLIRSPVVKTWSRDHTCTRILTRTVFGICSDFLCASRSCHTTLKLT